MYVECEGPQSDGLVWFKVHDGSALIRVFASPRGLGVDDREALGEGRACKAENAVSEWILDKEEDVRGMYVMAGRTLRSSRELLREVPLEEFPVVAARREADAIIVVVQCRATSVELTISNSGSIVERYEVPEELDLADLEGGIESAARYLVAGQRLSELGGDAVLEQLLRDFWIFGAKTPSPMTSSAAGEGKDEDKEEDDGESDGDKEK